MSNEHVAAADAPLKRFQCITIDAESVVLNGEDFDRMTAEITRLRADVDRDKNRECANAWHTVCNRLMEIDPNMPGRTSTGLGDVLSLINELANRPALDGVSKP